MKKIILAVILVAATGGITYYLLQNNNQTGIADFNQEQIIGKWRMDSLEYKKDSVSLFVSIAGVIDSSLLRHDYVFQKGGIVIKYRNDSVQGDTANYEWTNENHLLWKEPGDPAGESFTVNLMNKDSLVLRTKDSAIIYFRKIKR